MTKTKASKLILLLPPVVLDAFKRYDEGYTMKEIVDYLKLKGVRTKNNGEISINSLTRMLHNRKYIGEYKYHDVVCLTVFLQ